MCILAVVTIVYLVATGKTSALRQATGYDIQTVKEELAEANDKIEELEERIEELERQRL
jgi:predicted  nucleic acid-binding Zn-ribbon protein